MPPFPESPRYLSPFPGNLFSLHCLDFQAEDRLTPRWHVGQPCGKVSWESLVGKPRWKATDPLIHATGSVTLLLQLGRKAHVHSPLEPITDSPGETPEVRKIHESTQDESSASGPDSTQGLRPRHRRERNHERPPSNTHDNWPFLRPPEQVPESPS